MMKRIKAADGQELDCWMKPAEGASRGGLVVVQEIFGVTDQLKGVAAKYAALGYDTAVPALFDRQKPGTVVPFDQGPVGRDLMMSADLEETMLDIDAAVQALKAGGAEKVAVMGFCWGGGLAIRSAQKLGVACAVAFYGTRLPQYLDSPLRAPLLAHFGETDDHVPPEMLKQAQDYLPQMEAHLYKAGHAFANDARPSYVKEEADKAHARTEAFLREHVG